MKRCSDMCFIDKNLRNLSPFKSRSRNSDFSYKAIVVIVRRP